MAGPLIMTDPQGRFYMLDIFSVQELSVPLGLEERPLIGNTSLLVARVETATERLASNLHWTLNLHPVNPNKSVRSTAEWKSLFLGWCNAGTVLTLTGPDLGDLLEEPLRRLTTGSDLVFAGILPWWGTGVVVKVDGAVQSSGYTTEANLGRVTFDSPVSSTAQVTATVARQPQIRVLSVNPQPQNKYSAVRWAPVAVLREETPA